MSTSQLSNQLAKEATPQNTFGNTAMTLTGITREYWILKKLENQDNQGSNLFRRKLTPHQWYIIQITRHRETTTKEEQRKEKQPRKFDRQNTLPSNPSPDTYVRTQRKPTNQQ